MRRALGIALLTAALFGQPRAWRADVVFTAPAKLGGCVVADLDSRHAGNEIATVCSDGSVYVVRFADGAWKHERVARTPGEMIQCAAGDVLPDNPGDELVVVGVEKGGEDSGARGAAHLVRHDGKAWRVEALFKDSALLHGACVGDLDPDRPGNEVLVVGFSDNATLLFRTGAKWQSRTVAALGSPGKNAVPFRGGAAVVCAGGTVQHVAKRDGKWTMATLDTAPAGQARIGTDGERLLAARDDGKLGLIADGKRVDIYDEPQKLRGAVLADVDPHFPGAEAATAGYQGNVVVLRRTGRTFKPIAVYQDTAKLHHLAAGVLPGSDTTALVTCGYSGRLAVIRR